MRKDWLNALQGSSVFVFCQGGEIIAQFSPRLMYVRATEIGFLLPPPCNVDDPPADQCGLLSMVCISTHYLEGDKLSPVLVFLKVDALAIFHLQSLRSDLDQFLERLLRLPYAGFLITQVFGLGLRPQR